nr:neurensin-2 isoform X1 [Cavia porcellus]
MRMNICDLWTGLIDNDPVRFWLCGVSKKHSNSGSNMLGCNPISICNRGATMVEEGKWQGVWSYLHVFYEDCTGTALSDDPEGSRVLCPCKPCQPSLCWKISLSSGSLLLLLGIAALTTGYAVPPKLETVSNEQLPMLDSRAADYNKALSACRLAGTALCGAAGILLAICLLWAVSGWLNPEAKAEPLDTEADNHVEVFRDEPEHQLSPIFHNASDQSWFSTSRGPLGQSCVQTGQPKRDS